MNRRVAGGSHRFELLRGGRHGGLDRGDLAPPTLLFGLGEAVCEVGVDLLQPWQLGWVYSK